jgi:hypothetical protein
MLLGKPHLPLRCPKCGGRSRLDRQGKSTRIALVILAVAFIVWFGIARLNAIPTLPAVLAGVIAALVWAVAVLLAFYVFTFRGRLLPIPSDELAGKRLNGRALVSDFAFQLLMLAWMYFVYRSLFSST